MSTQHGATVGIDCEKCKVPAAMETRKIFRFSGCLVAIGFSVLVPALCALLSVTFCAILGTVTGGTGAAQVMSETKAESIERLKTAGLPAASIADFDVDGHFETKAGFTPEQLKAAEDAELEYTAAILGAGGAATVMTGMGVAGVIVTYGICIPTFVLGLVLVLRKKVWRCRSCGYVFDRA